MSLMILTLILASSASVFGPTPGIARTESGARNSIASSSLTTVMPPGLHMPEAILAMSLLGPMPTDAVNRSSSRIAALILRQISSANV